jgi:glycoside/pentoside/hexuronide:cation symporter, GPH family
MSAARLPVWLKVSHGMGAMAYGIKDNGFSVFLLIFYNQVLGIDAGIVGTAIMFALIFDAFLDPILGELSDRTQSRWGRRLPWLYSASIPVGLAWLALWHPPTGNDFMTVIWLFFTAVLARFLIAACEVPSIALVPELTSDYDERTRLMRFRFLFAWVGGLVMLMLAYGLFFTGPKGVSDPAGYAAFGLTGALIITFSVLLSALAQHRWVAKQSPPRPPNKGLFHAVRDMRETLSTPAFLWLVGAALFGLINQGATFALTNYLLVYLWRLSTMDMMVYGLVLFGSVVVAFLLATPISLRLGKKNAAIACAFLTLSFNTFLYGGWLAGFVPGAPDAPNKIYLFVLFGIMNSFAVAMMILTQSMMAEVVDAAEHDTGRRSEGLFYAGYFLMQKCAVGVGTFVAGMILKISNFPANAKVGNVDIGVLDRLALFYVATMLTLGIIGMLIMRNFPITRADHEKRMRIKALAHK